MKNNKKTKTEEYSYNNDIFKCVVRLAKNCNITDSFEFSLNKSVIDVDNLTYDSVLDTAYCHMEKKYPEVSFPEADIKGLFIKYDKKFVPILPDYDKNGIKEAERKYKRFLVLPSEEYCLTEEAKLFYNLIKEGIIPEDSKFDYDKMHRLLSK